VEPITQKELPEPPSKLASKGPPKPPKPPRLWPAVALTALFWAGAIIIRQFELQYFILFIYSMASAALLFVAFFVWWWTRRGIPLGNRALGFFAVLATGAIALPLCDKSVGIFGLLFTDLPVVLTAWTFWMLIARRFRLSYAGLGALVVMVLAWTPFTLQRMDGLSGDLHADIYWRWTPSAEDRFKAELAAQETTPVAETGSAAWTPVTAETTWTGFRGPDRDGVLHGVKISTNWSAKPPQLTWRRRVGPAWSSMTVIADRLFTQEQRDNDEAVVCYEAGTGREIWAHTDEARFEEAVSGAGPRGTPTFANGRIFTLGATGILNCLDPGSGKKVWSRTVTADADSKPPMWGFSASPLVAENLVFVFGGGDAGKSLLAYRASSGELAWAANAGPLSYSSPQMETLGGKKQLLIVSDTGLASFDPQSGKQLWQFGQALPGAPRTEQPHRVGSDQLLAASLNGSGICLVDVTAEPGDWKVAERWKSDGMRPEFPDMVVYDGHAFGFDISTFCCVDLATGKRTWKGGRYGHGQVILLADQGLLLVLSEKGEAVLLKANPEHHEELGRFQALHGKTWNHPVVAGGHLYVRNAEEMACYDLGGQ
jgi:outer membrane protein assembly factor BamB